MLVGNVKVDQECDLDSFKLSDFNKELKLIRSTRMETGCSCKPLKIDKLSVIKMKAELISMDCSSSAVEKLTKSELTSLLREKIGNCILCTNNNCFCVQMGLPCTADSCGCLRNTNCRKTCGNINGQRIYDSDEVNAYRCQFLPANSKLRQNLSRRASL